MRRSLAWSCGTIGCVTVAAVAVIVSPAVSVARQPTQPIALKTRSSRIAGVGAKDTARMSRRHALVGSVTTSKSVADKKIAHRAMLRLTDLPQGWKKGPGHVELGPACGLKQGLVTAASGLGTARFTNLKTIIVSSVSVYRSAAAATHWFSRLTSRAARSCRKTLIAHFASPGKLSVSALPIAPVGTQRAGTRYRFKHHGMGPTFTEDFEFVRAGRGLGFMIFRTSSVRPSVSLEAQLTKIVTERVASGLMNAQ